MQLVRSCQAYSHPGEPNRSAPHGSSQERLRPCGHRELHTREPLAWTEELAVFAAHHRRLRRGRRSCWKRFLLDGKCQAKLGTGAEDALNPQIAAVRTED